MQKDKTHRCGRMLKGCEWKETQNGSQTVPEPGSRLLTFCFALLQESPPEIFIEGIFQPSYKSGKLHVLENLLESIDPTLESWGKYLIAACQHLQKKNYYHILYELQQFMKVTAAPSCLLPLSLLACHVGRLCRMRERDCRFGSWPFAP